MRYLGVESIIVPDTYNGVPLNQLVYESASRVQQLVNFLNKKTKEITVPNNLENLKDIFYLYCPWLPYYLSGSEGGMEIPTGAHGFYKGREIKIQAPNEDRMDQCLDFFHDGDDVGYFPDNFKLGNAQSPILLPPTIEKLVQKYHREYSNECYVDEERLIEYAKTFYNLTFPHSARGKLNNADGGEKMFDAKFGEGTWAEFTKASFEEQNIRQTVAKTLNDAMQNCTKVSQKLPQDVRDTVADHLRENHYFLAYKTTQVKFLRLGMGDTNAFAEAVRRIKLTPGKELSTHITEYNEAMKRWASVLYLSQLITGHAPTGEDNVLWLLNLDVDEYIVLIP